MVNYFRGPTFRFLYSGLGLLVAGIYLMVKGNFIGFLLLLTGIPVSLSVNGILWDNQKRRYKSYFNFFLFKAGRWRPFENIQNVLVKGFNESAQMNSRGSSSVIRTRGFMVSLVDSKGNIIEVREFREEKLALDLKEVLKKSLNQKGNPENR